MTRSWRRARHRTRNNGAGAEAADQRRVAGDPSVVAESPEPDAREAAIVGQSELGCERVGRVPVDCLPAGAVRYRQECNAFEWIERRRERAVVESRQVSPRDPDGPRTGRGGAEVR